MQGCDCAKMHRGVIDIVAVSEECQNGIRKESVMGELVYQAARREAERLFDRCWDGVFPVDLRPVTYELGVEVFYRDLTYHVPGAVLESISGVTSKGRGKPAGIVVNSCHTDLMRRFILAHQLGHVVDRKNIAGDDEYSFVDSRDKKYDLHEFFADEFAAALLMPASDIRRMQDQYYTEREMAEHFAVPVENVKRWISRLERQK